MDPAQTNAMHRALEQLLLAQEETLNLAEEPRSERYYMRRMRVRQLLNRARDLLGMGRSPSERSRS